MGWGLKNQQAGRSVSRALLWVTCAHSRRVWPPALEYLGGIWRQGEASLGLQQGTVLHLAPGYVLQFLCSTYCPKPELLGPGDTVLPELNAKMAWSPLNWDVGDSF